jgi:hypothetical protein
MERIAMAVGTIAGNRTLNAGRAERLRVFPVSLCGDWFILNSAVNVADNAGSNVLQVTSITREAMRVLEMCGDGTGLELCVQYVFGESWTGLVTQMIGLDMGTLLGNTTNRLDLTKCLPEALHDADGNHDLAFGPVPATDKKFTDGVTTFALTAPKTVDCRGASFVVPAVKTAATGAGAANCRLLGKLI